MMVRDFHRIIGEETRAEMLKREGRLPDMLLACVGGGSNSIGLFHAFIGDEQVKLVGGRRSRRTQRRTRPSMPLASQGGAPERVLHGSPRAGCFAG